MGLSEISLAFSIAILFLGLSAAFMGHFVEKYGPRASGLLSTLCFAAGLSAAAAAAMVGIMGLFNGFGRIGWASVSDYIGRLMQ